MAYPKTIWVNDTTPAINADNLNKIEQGIYDNSIANSDTNLYVFDEANAISELSQEGMFYPIIHWEQGNIQNGIDTDTSKDYRVRSVGYIPTNYVSKITVDRSSKSWRTYLAYYDSSKQYETTVNSDSSSVSINTSYAYFRIVVVDLTNSSWSNKITPSDVIPCYEPYKTSAIAERLPELWTFLQYPDTFETTKSGNSCKIKFSGSIYLRGRLATGRTFNALLSEIGQTTEITLEQGYGLVYNMGSKTWSVKNVNSASNVLFDDVIVFYVAWGEIVGGIGEKLAIRTDIYNIQNDIDEYVDEYYPSYYDTQVASVVSDIKEHSGLVGKSGISFIFCTDIHWSQNEKHSPSLVNKIFKETFVPTVILGGDYISQFPSSKQDAIDNMTDCLKAFNTKHRDHIYPIFGNHDRNSNQTDTPVQMTKAETYAIINSWLNENVVYGDYFDFYFDDDKSKTKFICLDTGAQNIDGGVIDSDSFAWLQNILNATDSDWHIVIIAHWLFSPSTWNHPLIDGVLTGSYTTSANSLFSVLDTNNSDNSKAKVEAIITGHVHCDYNDTTSRGIPIIFVDTDSKGAYGEYPATVGTISEQCFDTITIDYGNETIYCDRIGRGISRIINY